MLILNGIHINGLIENKLNGENIIDNLYDIGASPLESYPDENYFLNKDMNTFDRNLRSTMNSLEEKLDARSKFFKVQLKESIPRNDNIKLFSQNLINNDASSNMKKHLYNQTSMKIECLISVKNCMPTIIKEDKNKFSIHKLLVDRKPPKTDNFLYHSYFSTLKMKRNL
ncbi:Hypothetical protein SRAE_1000129400 [Strongyloides ratti]|uniref:Uncharacterized protein n=1 Tax=Strongyloides ratti TaxID=34506 RepID=A0A090MVP3_STRRB|nr:Hypothetical protein SRAE_1000129400 [Strongyloides ratti]CEF63028.1 Hypothetical protein SRAE_1000129400 [Strongyloides ratti]